MKKIINSKLAVLSVMILVVICSASVLTVYAQKPQKVCSDKVKYFKSILIEDGDTLWNIAEQYADKNYYNNKHEYIKELKRTNNLKSDKIMQGSYLIVTYYK